MRLDTNTDPSHNASSYPPNLLSNGSSAPASLKGLGPSVTNGSSADTNGNATLNRPTGPYFGHDREEVTRILIQGLADLGYSHAANTLSRESGFELEVPSVAAFRSAIQSGDWSEAEQVLFGRRDNANHRPLPAWPKPSRSPSSDHQTTGLPLSEGANRHEMLFLIRQQKYLELLEQRNLETALMVLRQELTPLHQDVLRLHTLSRCVSAALCCPHLSSRVLT